MTAAAPAMVGVVPRDQVTALVTKPFDIASLLQIADDAVRTHARSIAGPSGSPQA